MQKAGASQLRLSEQALERIRNHRVTGAIQSARQDRDSVSYRRVGRAALVGRKLIKCPHCREYLMEISRDTLVTIYRLPSQKVRLTRSQIRRCEFCKGEVGIVYT